MNKQSYKTVFSKRLGTLVAVGEHASSQGKANGATSGSEVCAAGHTGLGGSVYAAALAIGIASVSLAWAAPAVTALPASGQVAQGQASISQSGAVMNINQSTAKAVVNWQNFDIGQNAIVNIVQPGADAVMLNRVNSANPTQIFGQLNANGQVVLVNQSGVVFGKDGSVSATSFTASTLGITDANFMAGNNQFERNGSNGTVLNQGSLKATGGYVALLGASVSNEGQIQTQGGTAYLAAAETVKIPVSGSGRIKLELSPSSINAQVANAKGATIVTEGGQVYMQAAALQSAVASIIESGNVDTTGAQGGAVHLLADGGQIKVDGSITANSTTANNKGGDIVIGRDEATGVLAKATDVSGAKLESNAGFVETSGSFLKVDDISVKAKDWLLDPTDIEINNGGVATQPTYSQVTSNTVQTALNNGTDVSITTLNKGSTTTGSLTAGVPASSTDGNILVSGAIVKSGANSATLNLTADKNITVSQRIGLANGDAASAGNLNVILTAAGNIDLNAVVDARQGNVFLDAMGAINSDGGAITALNLKMTSLKGIGTDSKSILINGPVTLAAQSGDQNTSSSIYIQSSGDTMTVGSVDGLDGITATGSISLKNTDAAIQINKPLLASTDITLVGNSSNTFVPAILVVGKITGNGKIDIQGTGTNGATGVGLQATIRNTGTETIISAPEGDISLASTAKVISDVLNNNKNPITIEAGVDKDSTNKIIAVAGAVIEQNTASDVTLTTTGQGNLTAPMINMKDQGKATLAAGQLVDRSIATGGQVLYTEGMVNGNLFKNNILFALGLTENIDIFTGSETNSAVMSKLSSVFGTLHLDGQNKNAVSNAAYGDQNIGNVQVRYREKIMVDLTGVNSLNNSSNTYGDIAKDNQGNGFTAAITAIQNANLNNPALSWTTVAGNKFDLSASGLIDTLSLNNGVASGSGYLKATNGALYTTTSSTYTTGQSFPTVTVNKAKLTVITGSKTYDGQSSLTVGTSGGKVTLTGITVNNAGESAELDNGSVVTISSKDVKDNATNKVTNLSNNIAAKQGATLDLANYDLTDQSLPIQGANTNLVTISKATATATAISDSTVYNGKVQSLTGYATSGVYAGDEAEVAAAVINPGAQGQNFGAYTNSVSAQDSANYIIQTTNGTLTIDKAKLVATGNSSTVTYNAAKQSVSGFTVSGLQGSDTVDSLSSVRASGATGRNVGTFTNAVTAGTETNYTVSTVDGKLQINQLAITLDGVKAADKLYDGNNVATLQASSSGILGNDVVKLTGATGTFASKNVARDSSGNVVAQAVNVLLDKVSLSGEASGNYSLITSGANVPVVASAKITPKELTVTGTTAADKVYDGSTVAAISTAGAQVAGVVTGDSVSVSNQAGVGNFASKNVAFDSAGAVTGQAVAVSGLALSGADASNYSVVDRSGAVAKVLLRALSITGSVAQDKYYDGGIQAKVSPGTLGNLVAGESLAVSASGQFADADTGAAKKVLARYALSNGSNGIAKNYSLADGVLQAAVLPAGRDPVQPLINPASSAGVQRVLVGGSGPSGAAQGVLTENGDSNREACSDLSPEKCTCQASAGSGAEVCFGPSVAPSTKP